MPFTRLNATRDFDESLGSAGDTVYVPQNKTNEEDFADYDGCVS